ncbi:MAG: hypothetical protein ACKVP7_26735 [Hyphomicrobiaceae bacterium]
MRTTTRALVAAAALLIPSVAAAGKATTTRIETRPFYGATVTLEEGVRVFRPLPYHDRVIINPGGRTNLSLGFEETRNYNYNYDRGGQDRDRGEYESGGASPFYGSSVGDGPSRRGERTAAKRYVPIGRERSAPPAVIKPVAPHAPKH